MKTSQILYSGLTLFFVAVVAGCGSLGEIQLSDEQVAVTIGQAVLDRPEKVEVLRENKGVERMYNYLWHYLRDGKVRPSIKVHVTISEFRVGWGRDMMGIEVSVTEQNKELKRFHLVDTTDRGSQVKRLTKSLAERTYEQIKQL